MFRKDQKNSRIVAGGGIFFSLFLLFTVLTQNFAWLNPFRSLKIILNSGFFQFVLSFIVIVYLFFAWRQLRESNKQAITERALVASNTLGQVQISADAIQDIVKRIGRNTLGVKGMSVKVKDVGDGLAILTKIEVDGDSSISDIGKTLQEKIQQKLETMAGIYVKEVRVIVEAVQVNERARTRVR